MFLLIQHFINYNYYYLFYYRSTIDIDFGLTEWCAVFKVFQIHTIIYVGGRKVVPEEKENWQTKVTKIFRGTTTVWKLVEGRQE